MIEPTISWGDIFAGLAFLLSCFATGMTLWFNHRQNSLIQSQERLNNMLLQQGERDARDAARADLGATFIKLGSSKYRLKVWNKGKATARNIRIDFPDGNDIVDDSEIREKFPLESLDQHQSVELTAALYMTGKLKHTVRLIWEDNASGSNEKVVYPTL